MNHPNTGFNFSPLIFFDNCVPMKIPTIAIADILPKKFQSIFRSFTDEKNPIRELIDIITKEVPMATFMGIFRKLTNAGIIIKPPPAPTNPVKNPTTEPSPTAKKALFFCEDVALISNTLFFRIILYEAAIIKHAKIRSKKIFFVITKFPNLKI